mmetsp:Transcript_75971/g.220638  ORF Transcript_75971/g.220638 Transcript_75971/m.220638 type:complete len:85 (-) Transcript_75971:1451-1705(-)
MFNDVVEALGQCHGAGGALARELSGAPPDECSLTLAEGPERRVHGPLELCRCIAVRCSNCLTCALTLPSRGASLGSGLWRDGST